MIAQFNAICDVARWTQDHVPVKLGNFADPQAGFGRQQRDRHVPLWVPARNGV
jgi:hypothetical protein